MKVVGADTGFGSQLGEGREAFPAIPDVLADGPYHF
jgi:hypothetical protein